METQIIKEIHDTIENALIVENYPYGFRLKTKIRYWIETKGDKQRFCSQTLNPKTNLWNNAKKGTYTDLILMFKEDLTGIKTYHFSLTYSDEESFKKLLDFLGDYRNDYINKIIKLAQAIYKTRKCFKVSCKTRKFRNKKTGEIKEVLSCFELNDYEEIKEDGEEEKQKEVSKTINNIFVDNALKEGLSIEEIKKC